MIRSILFLLLLSCVADAQTISIYAPGVDRRHHGEVTGQQANRAHGDLEFSLAPVPVFFCARLHIYR